MKGLELAEAYYHAHGKPLIEKHFAADAHRIATGLVGPGSECFGFDDAISRDHDWGPGFCLWLTESDTTRIGGALQAAYQKLPAVFMGYGPRQVSPGEEQRTGVCSIGSFYTAYTGLDRVPMHANEWLRIPEHALALCTNGKVFNDPLGEFSEWRDRLKRYYPEDVRLKKIASRCVTVAQSGQYNFIRGLKRGETFAVRCAEVEFCKGVLELVFLLNRAYAPFYKWLHRAVKSLPVLGPRIHTLIAELTATLEDGGKVDRIEAICALLIDQLKKEGLSDRDSDFLLDHAPAVHGRIQDPELGRSLTVVT
jgi:hypothetical protein